MSIGSVVSNAWTPPFRSRSTNGSPTTTVFTPPPGATGAAQGDNATASSSPTASASGLSAAGAMDPFRQLSSDIQALLVQVQGSTAAQAASTTGTASTSTGSSAVGTNAIGATDAGNAEQQLATDLQSLLAQSQNTDAGSGQNGQTAGAGHVQPHHHHHHRQGGGQEASNAAAGAGGTATASSTTASSATTTSSTAASGSDGMVSHALAADIMQALQAYGSRIPAATGPALTA